MLNSKTLRLKLDAVRQEIRNLIVLGMRPDIGSEKRDLIHQLERSARAELKARKKTLDYHLSRTCDGKFLWTPEQHERRAVQLREWPSLASSTRLLPG